MLAASTSCRRTEDWPFLRATLVGQAVSPVKPDEGRPSRRHSCRRWALCLLRWAFERTHAGPGEDQPYAARAKLVSNAEFIPPFAGASTPALRTRSQPGVATRLQIGRATCRERG